MKRTCLHLPEKLIKKIKFEAEARNEVLGVPYWDFSKVVRQILQERLGEPYDKGSIKV